MSPSFLLVFMTLHPMDMPLPSLCTFGHTHPLLPLVFHSSKQETLLWLGSSIMGKRSARFHVAPLRRGFNCCPVTVVLPILTSALSASLQPLMGQDFKCTFFKVRTVQMQNAHQQLHFLNLTTSNIFVKMMIQTTMPINTFWMMITMIFILRLQRSPDYPLLLMSSMLIQYWLKKWPLTDLTVTLKMNIPMVSLAPLLLLTSCMITMSDAQK